MLIMPDSPHYFIANGDMESAIKSLSWYRAYDEVDSEIKEMVQFVKSSSTAGFWEKMNEFRKVPHYRKGLIIVFMLFIFQQATGLNSMMAYIGTMLEDVQFQLFNSSLVVTISYFLSIISVIISIFLIEKCGRKGLQIISCIGIFISLFIMGTNYLLIRQYGVNTAKLQLLPVVSVFVFEISLYV